MRVNVLIMKYFKDTPYPNIIKTYSGLISINNQIDIIWIWL